MAQSSHSADSPKESEAGSQTTGLESVEELLAKHKEYPVFQSPFEFQETYEKVSNSENNDLKSLDMTYTEMREDEAKRLGQAVAKHQSLEVLTILLDSVHQADEKLSSPTSMWPMDSFLTAAFLGPDESRNTSILSLFIASSGTDGDIMRLGVLPQVIRENKRIRQFTISWSTDDGTSRAEMQDLFEALHLNSTIEALSLPKLIRWDFPVNEDNGYIDQESFLQIVKLVERNTSIRKLVLYIGECRGGTTDVNLEALYRALASNSTIRIVRLNGPFFSDIAASEFSQWIRTTSTLRKLELVSEEQDCAVLMSLALALWYNKSLRKITLEDFDAYDEDVHGVMVDSLKTNKTIQEFVFDPESEWGDDLREILDSRN